LGCTWLNEKSWDISIVGDDFVVPYNKSIHGWSTTAVHPLNRKCGSASLLSCFNINATKAHQVRVDPSYPRALRYLVRLRGLFSCNGGRFGSIRSRFHFRDSFAQAFGLRFEDECLNDKNDRLHASNPGENLRPKNKIAIAVFFFLSLFLAALGLLLIVFGWLDGNDKRPFIRSYSFWSAVLCGVLAIVLMWSIL
jgi:hypothetical protein